jgi:hypothetical protein
MARPPKQGLDYFPHDTNASNDRKLQALLSLRGLAGLGFYWYLVEQIYKEDTFSLDVSDAETIQILCRNMGINEQEWHRNLTVTLKYGLFNKSLYEHDQKLCSNGVMKRAKEVVEKRLAAKQDYDQKHGRGVSDAETTPEMGG